MKVSENPPAVWPEVESISEFTGRWWVVHTKSRNEKALAHDLMGRKISYFLPMSWRSRSGFFAITGRIPAISTG